MFLAYCLNISEDAIICDLAEYYNIYNYKDFNPERIGVLIFGLRENSRIKMLISKQKLTLEENLLAIIADKLAFIAWSKTKDAESGENRPKSIYKSLNGIKDDNNSEIEGFSTGEDFINEWKRKAME